MCHFEVACGLTDEVVTQAFHTGNLHKITSARTRLYRYLCFCVVMYRYLVSLGDVNKLVSVDCKKQLKTKCAQAFNYAEGCICLEVFLDEFGDYAEVADDELPDKGKIRLRLVEDNTASFSSVDTVPITSVVSE